jgi:hypothetical protein
MAKSFDFNKIKPKTMNVTLTDEAKTTLAVMTPDKRLRDDLVSLYEGVDEADEDEVNEALYDLSARVMSRNKQGIEITPDQLKKLYPDHTYIMAFLNAYVDFIGELTNSKN